MIPFEREIISGRFDFSKANFAISIALRGAEHLLDKMSVNIPPSSDHFDRLRKPTTHHCLTWQNPPFDAATKPRISPATRPLLQILFAYFYY